MQRLEVVLEELDDLLRRDAGLDRVLDHRLEAGRAGCRGLVHRARSVVLAGGGRVLFDVGSDEDRSAHSSWSLEVARKREH